jgi:hypothetical protein
VGSNPTAGTSALPPQGRVRPSKAAVQLPVMSMFRRLRTAPLVVSLALIGAWLGHTLEYLRVSGTAGLQSELTGSIHAYMLPAGIGLGLAAVLVMAAAVHAYQSLGRRLRASRSRLLAVLTTHAGVEAAPPPQTAWSVPGLAQLWFLVLSTQLGIYLVQERTEALRVGINRPWLEAVRGVHWAAPLVHAAVALLLTGAALIALRLITRRRRVVERSERLLAALVARFRRRPDGWPLPRREVVRLRLRGTHLWSRPPPACAL